ncbi:hypothetical protein O6H91_10G039200 [Diphasiastrum complanatum]|uniref:Uncharacterized protein n=2 Tax=Diphasiastrum complanatum TaxID=34168 RepID=A0ACC2CGC6_DIPCM|nr:hypothetical protein O6H91_10G039200 [Diphasiastrum complanatum]KAJ7540968.1 hypothetical protein O6H91_10G039200 [Diphasiastrum complanatum]
MTKTSRYSEDLTRCGDKLPGAKASQDSEPLPSSDNTEQDDIMVGLQLPMQRSVSYNMFMLERKNASSEDPAAMTIEFLRARLLSERTVAKAAKERAQLLAKKVIELQRKLETEVAKRQKAEDLAETAMANISQAPRPFSSATVTENSEVNEVSSFRQMLLTNFSSQGYSGSCSADDERANAKVFEKEKFSGEDQDYSQKGKGLVAEEESTVRAANQLDNNLYQDAYCYGPWSFVYSGNDEPIFNDYSYDEKESSPNLSDQIPAALGCKCQTESLHINRQGIIETSNHMPAALLPVTPVRSVPAIHEDYVQDRPSSEMLARYQEILTEQKARNSAKDGTMGGGSSRENRGSTEYGCSLHADSMFGATAKVQSPSYQLCKKHQQENKRCTAENNFHFIPSKEAQTPGVMATNGRRKCEVSNSNPLLHKGFQKGATNIIYNNVDERDQSMREFHSNVQSSNFQAIGKHIRPASGSVLRAGVAEKMGGTAVNLKPRSKKINIIRPKSSIYVHEVYNCGDQTVSSIPRKDIKHSLPKHSSNANNSLPTQHSGLTTDPSSAINCNDCSACGRLQGSRNIIRSVPRRSDKYIRQQLECLERSANANATESHELLSLRRAQSYVDVSNSFPSSGAEATELDTSNGDSNGATAYSLQRSEQSNGQALSDYLSLAMEGKHECLPLVVSEQVTDTAQESCISENQNEFRICIPEMPIEGVIVQRDAPSEIENLQTQQGTHTSEAQIVFAEHLQPGDKRMNNFLCEATDLGDEGLARYIGSEDIQGRIKPTKEHIKDSLAYSSSTEILGRNHNSMLDEYRQAVHTDHITSGGPPTVSRYFGPRARDYSSLQEIESETDNIALNEVQPSVFYTAESEGIRSTKPPQYLVLQRQSSTSDWRTQDNSSTPQIPWDIGSAASQLIPLAKSTRYPYGPW